MDDHYRDSGFGIRDSGLRILGRSTSDLARWTCLLAVLTSGCATAGAVPRPFPSPDWSAPAEPGRPAEPIILPPAAPDPVNNPPLGRPPISSRKFDGGAVANAALGFRGIPYRLGGTDPSGFDCSGLVQYVFAQYGISVPRVVEQQYQVGAKIAGTAIEPGDLLFFSTKGPGATHVGIAIGGDKFVHAPTSTGVVRVEAFTSAYWWPRYVGARRLRPDRD